MKKRKSYGVSIEPKYPNSGYVGWTLKPYLSDQTWSKARAEQEKRFALNKGRSASGYSLKKTHKAKIVEL